MYLPQPNDTSEFTPVPAGTHLALCYRVIDLGTQTSNYQGQEKERHQVMLSWEVPHERTERDEPMVISRRYTWSMHEKSSLRRDLEAWRGKSYSYPDDPPQAFDTKNLLGKACMISVTHDMGRDGKIYANVSSVGKVTKGLAIPAMHNPPQYLAIDPQRWDQTVFDSLSDSLKDTIRRSPEYADLMRIKGGDSDGMLEDAIPF